MWMKLRPSFTLDVGLLFKRVIKKTTKQQQQNQLKVSQQWIFSWRSELYPQVFTECDYPGINLLDDCCMVIKTFFYFNNDSDRGALFLKGNVQEKCVVQRWHRNLHEETDGTENVTHWQETPLGGGILLYKIVPKKKKTQQKNQKAAPTVCVLCGMACKDRFMAVRWISTQPGAPLACLNSLLVREGAS